MEGKRVKTNLNENVYFYYEWGGQLVQNVGHKVMATGALLPLSDRAFSPSVEWRKTEILDWTEWIRDNTKSIDA